MPALEPHAPSFVLLACCLFVPLSGCDRVTGLFSEQKTPVKAEAKPEADTKAEAKAGAEAPEAAPAADATPPAEATAAPDAAPSQPCIIGSWDAIEYTAAVRHAIAKDPQLRSLKKTSSGGHITYVVAPPSGTSGTVIATADHLKYGFSGKVEGFPVRVDIDINGETEATYELSGEGRIVISKPSRNTMKVKANAKVEGLGSARQADKVDLDFDGSFVYECSEKELKVWRGQREGDAMVFARKTAG